MTARDVRTVRELAEDLGVDVEVSLSDGDVVLSHGRVREEFSSVEEACSALRASWVQS